MDTTAVAKQSPIEVKMVGIGERLEILEKSVSNLIDRLAPVRNVNVGVDKSETLESVEKASSPMKDRLSNYTDTIDALIYRVNSVISELEI